GPPPTSLCHASPSPLYCQCDSSALPFCSKPSPSPSIPSLSLHDALPISGDRSRSAVPSGARPGGTGGPAAADRAASSVRATSSRSEEHTSELQSLTNLVCRLLLEKKINSQPTRYRKRSSARQPSRTSVRSSPASQALTLAARKPVLELRHQALRRSRPRSAAKSHH